MSFSFTNRTGGQSTGAFASLNLGLHVEDRTDDVLANRGVLEAKYGPIQFMNQVHGDRIAVIEEVTQEFPTADALVTGIPGITLAVMVADCIPLLLKSNEVVAAVHVGRRGLVNEITRKTIALMKEMGALHITAIFGPAICGGCYEVSQELHDEVTASHPFAKSITHEGKPALDIVSALRIVLADEGVAVQDKFTCTFESQEHFSYRRDGKTGRQAGLISL
jgi:YfiH family protein